MICDILNGANDQRLQAEFAEITHTVHDLLLPIFGPHMQPHNRDKFSELFSFYGDAAFLDSFFNGSDFIVERELVLESMEAILKPFDQELVSSRELEKNRLMLRFQDLSAVVNSPQLHTILKTHETSSVFKEWYVLEGGSEEATCHISFWNAVQDFKSTSAHNMVLMRAGQIIDTYFGERSPKQFACPPELVDQVMGAYYEEAINKSMFNELEVFLRVAS